MLWFKKQKFNYLRFFSLRRYVLILSSVLVIGVLLIIGQRLSQSVYGKTDTAELPQKYAIKKSSLQVKSSLFTTNYFSLTIPPGYNLQTNSNPLIPGILYYQNFIKPDLEGSLIVSISIQTLPNGALSDLPAYRFRSQQASNFQLSNILVQGQSVSLFSATKDDGVTAFWVHNNYLATISLSSGMTEGNGLSNESEQSAIRTIINGWQWR